MEHAREDYNRIQDPAGLIPEGEPVFLIRGQDIAGPETLKAWADLHLEYGGDPELAYMARDHAEAMQRWQQAHNKKSADL